MKSLYLKADKMNEQNGFFHQVGYLDYYHGIQSKIHSFFPQMYKKNIHFFFQDFDTKNIHPTPSLKKKNLKKIIIIFTYAFILSSF